MSINSKFNFCNSIKESDKLCNSVKESGKLQQYLNGKSGLIFTEFNTKFRHKGKLRALDAIRFPELEQGIYRASGNYENIELLIKNNEIELIDVAIPGGFMVLVN